CGQRPVSPLVDISNYVMFEFGRPSHIFDLDKIAGELVVRWGKKGEQLKLLNGSTIEVDEQVGVIADKQAVESLAGIMGGDHTAVSDDTKNIYVEAAFWWPKAVMGRSRRYNFSTDAGHRFERGVDPAGTVEHIERITQLILEICGGEAGAIDDQVLYLPAARPVTLRVARAARVIGMPLTQADCAAALRRLSLPLEEGEGTLVVTPPPHRFDLLIEEDLIEEVARLIGYQNLPTTPPLAPITARERPEAERSRFAVRHRVAALGYQETINFSFVEAHWERELAGNADPIRLLNPIASQMSVMRSTLIGGLVAALKHNLNRKHDRVRLFELARVFKSKDAADQPELIAGLAWGTREAEQWGEGKERVDFYDVKGDVEALLAPRVAEFRRVSHPALHPGRSAEVVLEGRVIGVIGELHPQWVQAYELVSAPVLFELAVAGLVAVTKVEAKPVSKFQGVRRDLALIVDDAVEVGGLIATLKSAAAGFVTEIALFDVYRGKGVVEGKKSLAFKVLMQDTHKTLTDEEVDAAVAKLIRQAEAAGATLRV
ncbi:MAG TPA: phenylalanine--tRNA ligase subunit beta, partial [Chitinolyticbacter sp.]|nr:phenylalanine--tRNA ligase subunit beta [Chitinolyticbacter sp.]